MVHNHKYQKIVGIGVLVVGCSYIMSRMIRKNPKEQQKVETEQQDQQENVQNSQTNQQAQQQTVQSQQQSQLQEDDHQIADSKSSKQKKKDNTSKKNKCKTNKISIMKKNQYYDDNTPVKKQVPQKKLKFMTDVETEYSESERLRFKKDRISKMINDHTKYEKKEDQLFFQCLMMNLNETDNESEH